MPARNEIINIIGGSLGNVLEWYDFSLFGFFTDEISDAFFEGDDHTKRLITYALFGGAFFFRPVGGALFGYIGDRFGRVVSLKISLIMMGLSTLSLGCLPGYKKWGVTSIVLLTLIRILQGISVGGQLVGSMLYLTEQSSQGQEGKMGSLAMIGANVGTMMGSAVSGIFRVSMSDKDLQDYGWRIPFLFGVVVAGVGYITQKYMETSHEFSSVSQTELKENPVKYALKHSWRSILLVLLVDSMWCVGFYTVFVFLPEYAHSIVEPGLDSAFLLNTFSILICIFSLYAGGVYSDKVGYNKTLFRASVMVCLSCLPLFSILLKWRNNVVSYIFVSFTFAVIFGFIGGPIQAFMVHAFPDVSIRYSAMGIAYNGAQALFGGTALEINAAGTDLFLMFPAVWLFIVSLLSGLVLYFYFIPMEKRIENQKHTSTPASLRMSSENGLLKQTQTSETSYQRIIPVQSKTSTI